MALFVGPLGRLDPLMAGGACASASCLPSGDTVTIGVAGERECRVPVSRFAQHVVITGQPGMRKTTLTAQVVKQLVDAGVDVVLLEPAKVEYAELLGGSMRLDVYGDDGGLSTKRLETNPFAVDRGVKPSVWVEDVSNAIVDAYGMKEQPLPLHLDSLIRRLYRLRGIPLANAPCGNENWPTVKDFLEQVDQYINEETCSGKEVQQNVRGALVKRGRSMAEIPSLCTRKGIMASDLEGFSGAKVLQLADIGPNSGAFVGMLLLLRLIRAAKALGARRLHTVVVLEEAHSLLIDMLNGEPTMFSRVYESALAEMRASGIGFITVDQRPSLLPSGVLANSVTKIAFASTHGEDRSAIGSALGLSDEQVRRFGGLREGEALFSTAGSEGAGVVRLRGGRIKNGRR
ncbi:MAG TPA: hypothetical protein H9877_04685 [Candidatus Gordonibacter avicola]|nr:hypothetical protein [Candidatus Gordonibacter avicola]